MRGVKGTGPYSKNKSTKKTAKKPVKKTVRKAVKQTRKNYRVSGKAGLGAIKAFPEPVAEVTPIPYAEAQLAARQQQAMDAVPLIGVVQDLAQLMADLSKTQNDLGYVKNRVSEALRTNELRLQDRLGIVQPTGATYGLAYGYTAGYGASPGALLGHNPVGGMYRIGSDLYAKPGETVAQTLVRLADEMGVVAIALRDQATAIEAGQVPARRVSKLTDLQLSMMVPRLENDGWINTVDGKPIDAVDLEAYMLWQQNQNQNNGDSE